MDEIQKRKVVQHNDLISSVAKMDKIPLKIFELAVSCIDTDNPPKDNIIYLSKSELFTFFKVNDSNKHSRFKQAIEVMQKQAYFNIKANKELGIEYESIVPIPYIKWTDYTDEVILQFQPQIMPYLIELKKNFTQYALSDVMELNSKYSIILYKWLSMNYNQYEHYSIKGGRREEQLEVYQNPSISIKELRIMTDTINLYKTFKDFDSYVLKNSLKEINEHTHFNVTYEKLKVGRSIDRIQFHISKKEQPQELNGEYKAREQDPAYLQDKINKEVNQQALFAEAMQSLYTTSLLESSLLSPFDMQDITLMANLQLEVYPLYKQLEEIVGLQGVKKHLEYVSNKKLDYSKPNLVKYLKTAVMRYLDSGDTKQHEIIKTKFVKQSQKTVEAVAKDFMTENNEELSQAELDKIKSDILKQMNGEGLDHE
ncbi:RepB family plasmid replication initiator protein [Lactococcus raffinolactis]|uniref:RepB family plasmid replication initiator protein n=1 Tax=Pseudolactococcus raffinolactis TaxID=1366 RepID=UPI001E029AE4|nr:RepB family plasmid replication initiator protein [Lactococcus raffinolactis]MBW9331807.1 RepB family plasmid replication initiator protein [Lactococcus raffinolactis]